MSAPSETSAEPRAEEPTSIPIKERPIPPIPKSDTLAAILTSLPTLASPDPILAPLRDRLAALKDLSWIETDQLAFETREQKKLWTQVEKLVNTVRAGKYFHFAFMDSEKTAQF